MSRQWNPPWSKGNDENNNKSVPSKRINPTPPNTKSNNNHHFHQQLQQSSFTTNPGVMMTAPGVQKKKELNPHPQLHPPPPPQHQDVEDKTENRATFHWFAGKIPIFSTNVRVHGNDTQDRDSWNKHTELCRCSFDADRSVHNIEAGWKDFIHCMYQVADANWIQGYLMAETCHPKTLKSEWTAPRRQVVHQKTSEMWDNTNGTNHRSCSRDFSKKNIHHNDNVDEDNNTSEEIWIEFQIHFTSGQRLSKVIAAIPPLTIFDNDDECGTTKGETTTTKITKNHSFTSNSPNKFGDGLIQGYSRDQIDAMTIEEVEKEGDPKQRILDGPVSFGKRPSGIGSVKGLGRGDDDDNNSDGDDDAEKAPQSDYPKMNNPARNNFMKKRKFDTQVGKEVQFVRGVWIHGKSGVGKSYYARHTYPGAYIKSLTKWWDGYQGESNIILDDFDSKGARDLSYDLKIWADRYSCSAETKGGMIGLQHIKFVITSQYSIQDLWREPNLVEAMLRRFEVIHITMDNFGERILTITPPLVTSVDTTIEKEGSTQLHSGIIKTDEENQAIQRCRRYNHASSPPPPPSPSQKQQYHMTEALQHHPQPLTEPPIVKKLCLASDQNNKNQSPFSSHRKYF